MTPRLYHEGELAPGSEARLSPQASHHLARVLRAHSGDAVMLFNGDGNSYAATLDTVDNRRCVARVDHASPCDNESPLHITLLQGLSRHDRMDTTLQKATELGVSRIIPVICRHSRLKLDEERMKKKVLHWQQVIISACEQSGRCRVPVLSGATVLDAALQHETGNGTGLVLSPGAARSLGDFPRQGDRIRILIGPESGLDETELELAKNAGFSEVSLGPRILRTETAGPAAICAMQTLWGDLAG